MTTEDFKSAVVWINSTYSDSDVQLVNMEAPQAGYAEAGLADLDADGDVDMYGYGAATLAATVVVCCPVEPTGMAPMATC